MTRREKVARWAQRNVLIVFRPLCLLFGHAGYADQPCRCCGRYLSYEDLAVRSLDRPLLQRSARRARRANPCLTLDVKDCGRYPGCGCDPKDGCEIPF